MHLGRNSPPYHPALIPSCFFFTLLPLYYFSWQYTSYKHASQIVVKQQHSPIWTDAWREEWLSSHIVDPFDPAPLAAYCNKTTWNEKLVFNLDNANGGIGNVRGNLLDFILYAIEAGASIILPGMAARDLKDYSNVWGGRATFDVFFDEEWFLYAMSKACPQMSIYKPQPGQVMLPPLPEKFWPSSRRTDLGGAISRAAYVKEVQEWLKAQTAHQPDQVNLVNLERMLWNYDTRALPPGVRRTVGQLLRISPKVRRMAAIVIQQLAMMHYLVVDSTTPIPKGAFFGAHLRTESDAAKAGWLSAPGTNFTAQTDAYIAQALANGLSTIYVASGELAEVQRFKEKASLYKLNVTWKDELLIEPQDIEQYKALTWDQQALIDYEVLQRCSVFGGFVRSSFSFNIAITRNQWLEDQARVVDPWIVLHSEAAVAFDDGLSRIIGRDEWHEARIPRGTWP